MSLLSCDNLNITIMNENYQIPSFRLERGEVAFVFGLSSENPSIFLDILAGLITSRTFTTPAKPGRLTREIESIDRKALSCVLYENKSLYEFDEITRARQIGIVFEDPELAIFGTTVEEDFLHSFASAGWPRNRSVSVRILADYGLGARTAVATHHLSGGEKQRLNCATAFEKSPQLLICDFTNSNLDQDFLEKFIGWIKGHTRKGGAAIIAGISQDQLWEGCRAFYISNKILFEGYPNSELFPALPRERAELTKALTARNCGEADFLVLEGLHWLNRTDSVSLRLQQRQIGLLVGPNGSGKTTIANILTRRIPKNERRGSFTFSKTTSVYPFLALQQPERTFFFQRVYKELPDENCRRVCGLTESEDLFHPLALSRAKQKLLAVAKALYYSRKFVILDEPTCGMDFPAKKQFILLLNKFADLTVLLITHDRALYDLGVNFHMGA